MNVTLARSYEPFGDPLMTTGTSYSIYGFSGEQRDGTGLIYLRARYYGPAFGRFLSRDSWEGDPNQPMSYNGWLYVEANPVNLTDPSGMYGQLEVHRNLTLRQAIELGPRRCQEGSCAFVRWFGELIAMGNYAMDSGALAAHPRGGHPELHFVDQPTARQNAKAAVNLGDPYLFGAALHQVQDWYAHWNEGFRWWHTAGHGITSFGAGCGIEGKPCRRHQETIDSFYRRHPRPHVEEMLRQRYPAQDLSRISDDKLIDLYMQEFTTGAFDRERWRFGYDTDYFFEFTRRDTLMIAETAYWVGEFFGTLEPCLAEVTWLRYSPPTEAEVMQFLR